MKDKIEIYSNNEGIQVEIKVHFEKESVWLSQKLMAELFNKDTDTIGLHLKNIFVSGELDEFSTTEFFSVVQKEGNRKVSRNIKYYNLDAIISVGYRINSKQGNQFRQWATKRLKDYLIKGYAVNGELLQKQQQNLIELQSQIDVLNLGRVDPITKSLLVKPKKCNNFVRTKV